MSHRSTIAVALLFSCCATFGSWPTEASDSDSNSTFYTSSVLRYTPETSQDFSTITLITEDVFPALQGEGLAVALLQFPPGSVNVPHSHLYGTECLYLMEGTLDAGLIDMNNTLHMQTLQVGDLFVFPKGLTHFQINYGMNITAKALSAFSSDNPGRVQEPNSLFHSYIPYEVLTKSFGVTSSVIDQLTRAAAPPTGTGI